MSAWQQQFSAAIPPGRYDGKSRMKYSVLLPTRNRADLLRYAIESVRRQDYDDWEIIVSDNDSHDDTASYVLSVGDSRIRYVRTSRFLPVTENWNHALVHSSGDYLVMLGDDDCLLPGYFSTLARLCPEYALPELVYVQALQFAYPGVLPGHDNAFVQTGYCEFIKGKSKPFVLPPEAARTAVAKAMSLRFSFGFNMQHSLISRALTERLRPAGPFFQSPYPDYYATTAMLLTSRSTLVVSEPLVAIGISPKSFGHYYFTGREDEGTALLNNMGESSIPPYVRTVLLPGSVLITCWYVAMACIEHNFGREYGLRVDANRYRFLQVFYVSGRSGACAMLKLWPKLSFNEQLRYGARRALLFFAARFMPQVARRMVQRLGLFPTFDPQKRDVPYRTILELFDSYEKIRI